MGASASAFPVVAGIDLNHANLQGILVKELSLLTDISLFHLNSNSYFSGTIPEELFYKNFDALFLNNNQFESEIPQNLRNFPASVINLANNKLSGNIPASFGFMGSKLKEILFLNNQLTGCISEEVGLFTEIQVLDVSYNTLMGHVPDTLSCLQDIQVLNLPIQGSLLMDDGELDFSNQEVFSSPNMAELPSSGSMDCFFEELLKDSHACTHTHICNPLIVPAPFEEQVGTDDTAESAEKKSKKRPLGNREAVRKYREKKKARAASLEDEVVKLRALNQHLKEEEEEMNKRKR
ncbi:hypothetical protein Ahy_B03g065743 [Arachis hypogaea]|uniref:BZIP domain-containing protein n=1 Tax=Arachis hypogaea TaxID=3818 RepID=A0A445A295_ARAHY|nr:hypothetical protein Ahy_B03g065743 [Arachis hypogaea]